MIALADDRLLYFLDFADKNNLDKKISLVTNKQKFVIKDGPSKLSSLIKQELQHYFDGQLRTFTIPLAFAGSSFQQSVWKTLTTIPYGQTQSYSDVAHHIQQPTAFRAVAQANATNKCAIVIPCHRVINKNGDLGGYAGGLTRKQWLLNHEKQ